MKRDSLVFLGIIVAALFSLCQTTSVYAWEGDSGDWPKEIVIPGGSMIMYQPQPEELTGNLLKSRAAVSIREDETGELLFGAVWFDVRLQRNRDKPIATIGDVRVTDVRFPERQEENTRLLQAMLEAEMPKWDLEINLERLAASLELVEKRELAAQQIETSPPRIIFSTEPAVLVAVDGEPRLKYVEDTNLMRVINTPFTMLLSPAEKAYYLYAGQDTWYRSDDILGDWHITEYVPPEVAGMAPNPDDVSAEEAEPEILDEYSGPPPEIYVSTEPAELIVSYGPPEYTPINRTSLLYMSNTESDVLMYIPRQEYYVLLAGRWYRSRSLQGPWDFVPGGELPDDFARIPEDSPMGTVLYAVPGTDMAREAVKEASIPRTAAIERDKAELTVEYDGKPKFERIEGTELYYAVNTAIPVIWTGTGYYACDQAVWFIAPTPQGPWRVATHVPDTIYLIPPESPVYNVTYVRVYEATPEVVYVGYTPGYTHTYVYHDTVVYGTGYYWPGWYGRYYYPRHRTWGYHPSWDPWAGWSFGIGYVSSPFYFSIGYGDWYRGGWWGPWYYNSYRHGYYPRYRYRKEKHIGYRVDHPRERPDFYRTRKNKVRVVPIHNRPYIRGEKKRGLPRHDDVRVDERWLQHNRDGKIPTRPAVGPKSVDRPDQKRFKPLKTKPATGPRSVDRPGQDRIKTVPTRPAVGPKPIDRPKQERFKPVHIQPGIAPRQPDRPRKQEHIKSVPIRPAVGPKPLDQPTNERVQPVPVRPGKGPLSDRPEQEKTRPRFKPEKGAQPYGRQGYKRPEKIPTTPATGPGPKGVVPKVKGDFSTQQEESRQLSPDYKPRGQGEIRTRDFRGTVAPQGNYYPRGGMQNRGPKR